ncbi:MAG: glycosyltransferase [Candidatus Acidiferrum sp.]
MKILQLISSGGFYGAESVLLNLSVELQRSGHTCMVGVFENAKNANTEVGARAEIAGLAVRRIPCRSRFDWQTVRQIQKIIEEDGIDLVHAHGYKADFYALLAARLAEVPVTATCHNWLGESWSMRAYARLDRYLLRFFDGVAAVSNSVAEQLEHTGTRQRMRVIANGVPTRGPGIESRLADQIRKGDRLVVGAVGRLSLEKGAAVLIEAASKICPDFPQAFFVVVGDGPLRSSVEAGVRELGITGQFLFTGERNDVDQIYRSFDVYVLPSFQEGMPMALLEAMAAGLPVVATKVGGVPDLVCDPSVGTLVEPGDPTAFAAGIRGLLSDQSRRERMGSNARRRVEDHFSAAAMARNYGELYQEALLRRSGGNRSLVAATGHAKVDVARRAQR